jgi:hypothetical protein
MIAVVINHLLTVWIEEERDGKSNGESGQERRKKSFSELCFTGVHKLESLLCAALSGVILCDLLGKTREERRRGRGGREGVSTTSATGRKRNELISLPLQSPYVTCFFSLLSHSGESLLSPLSPVCPFSSLVHFPRRSDE